MTATRKIIIVLIAAATLMLGSARQVAAQSIHMKPAATLEAGPICVGDVATIEGVDPELAEKFSRTTVTTVNRATTISAEQVLLAIITQNGSTATAIGLQVNGPIECSVQIGNGLAASSDGQDTGANQAVNASVTSQPPVLEAAAQVTTPPAIAETPRLTLADQLTAQVIEQLGVKPQDVRIDFDTVNPLLDQPVGPDEHWVFRPLAHNFIGSMTWDTQLIQGSHPMHHLNVQASVLERTTVVIAEDSFRAGDIVTARQIKTQEHWMDRRISTLFSKPQDVIGQMAVPIRGIAAGTMLDQRDFKPVPMAATGEMVTVYLISGGLTIKSQARALNSGRMHEMVLLQSDGNGNDNGNGKSEAQYQATLIGHDIAVVGGPLDPILEAKLKGQQ